MHLDALNAGHFYLDTNNKAPLASFQDLDVQLVIQKPLRFYVSKVVALKMGNAGNFKCDSNVSLDM